jgi:hypothetical protein
MSIALYNVGLAGDGDEVAAICDVEREFGVKLDYSDASNWRTAGDVFLSLKSALAANNRHSEAVWERFATSLTGQSGVKPGLIAPDSPLLLPPSNFWRRVTDMSVVIWILVGACLALSITLAALDLI